MRARRTESGLPEQPLCVTASRSLALPVKAPLFRDPGSHVVVLTNSVREPPPCECRLTVERLPGEELDLALGMAKLRERHGVRALLLEGGPTVLAAMLEAGLVGEPSVVEGTALPRPRRGKLVSVLESESFLYLRYAIT